MTDENRQWLKVGRFETVGAAVQRINEIEGAGGYGLFLRTYVDPPSTDEEALRDLEYKGATASYVIRREHLAH